MKHEAGFSKSGGYSTQKGMSDKMFKAFTEGYGLDYKETLQNAITCDEGKPDLDDWMKFDDPKSLPKCFANFDIKKQDRSKCHGVISCSKFE